MSKILPLIIPPTETYQSTSFILGIILQYENIKNIFHNLYINLMCNDTKDIWKVELQFEGVSWEDYRLKGIAEMDLYYLKNISQEKCAEFLKERIEQGNYLLIYDIDEFYLSYNEYFHEIHHVHDTYLYGYDSMFFWVMAYRNNKLQMFPVPQNEIIEGLYGRLKNKENMSFCTFRPFHAAKVDGEYKIFLSQLNEYIKGGINEGHVYGNGLYDVITKCICAIFDGESVNKGVDLCVFRMLWEHKKIIKIHLDYYSSYKKIADEIMNGVIDLVQTAFLIFMLATQTSHTDWCAEP